MQYFEGKLEQQRNLVAILFYFIFFISDPIMDGDILHVYKLA